MKFALQPDLRLLYKHGYLQCTEEELENAIVKGWGQDIEVGNVFYENEQAFNRAFAELIENYELHPHLQTLAHITLVENDLAYEKWWHVNDGYESKLRTKQLAQLLMCLHETPQQKLQAIKLNTLTETAKITDSNLIGWIGKLIANGLSNADFIINELGQDIYHLIADDNGRVNFDVPLNYERIKHFADKQVKKPSRLHKTKLYHFLVSVLHYLEHETHLRTGGNTQYTDGQMNFLFDLAVIYFWLDPGEISSEPKDYMYTLFANQSKNK